MPGHQRRIFIGWSLVLALSGWQRMLPAQTTATNNFSSTPAADYPRAAEALIARVLPEQAGHFTVQIIPSYNGQDVFEVETRGDQTVLRGNNAVSVASALNWYLHHECHCDISWNGGDQLDLPRHLPLAAEKVRVVSPHHYRYAYNFCTHGYTMAWWDWPQWQHELDYLAMNGINLALIIDGHESVW